MLVGLLGSCEILANDLMQYHGVPAVRIHGDMAQYERTGALEAQGCWWKGEASEESRRDEVTGQVKHLGHFLRARLSKVARALFFAPQMSLHVGWTSRCLFKQQRVAGHRLLAVFLTHCMPTSVSLGALACVPAIAGSGVSPAAQAPKHTVPNNFN